MSTDPVVLITGATGDFGPHVVRAFAAKGARLALTARKLEPAEALIRDLGLSADRALPSVVDVTNAASVAAWIDPVSPAEIDRATASAFPPDTRQAY